MLEHKNDFSVFFLEYLNYNLIFKVKEQTVVSDISGNKSNDIWKFSCL